MLMPLFAVKSFDNSTRALAGSQAAQHSVRSFACALPPIATPALSTVPSRNRFSLPMNASVRATLVACGWIAIAQFGAATGRISLFTRQRARDKAAKPALILGFETEFTTRTCDHRVARGWCRAIKSSFIAAALASLVVVRETLSRPMARTLN